MLGIFSKKNQDVANQSSQNGIQSKLVVLVILDGLGISFEKEHNAVFQARTPFLDTIWTKGRKTLLHASGTPVGLPEGEVGNSEVGHLNIGAGRVVYQSLPLINDSIMSGQFQQHPKLLKALEDAKQRGVKLHLMGILSAGGVHGHISHLFELLEMCKKHGVHPYVHAFMDGRDVGLTDGAFYIEKLMAKFRELGMGTLASMSGRFYSMDRDNRWERVQLAYDCMTGVGKRKAVDPFEVIQQAYAKKENDQIFLPTTMVDSAGNPVGAIQDGDVCIMFNYREDRARETIKAFAKTDFDFFPRRHNPEALHFISMMGYGEGLNMDVVFPPKTLENTLSSVISQRGLNQLHISETEKYAHVTYFFNGGIESTHPGEQFLNIPSKKVFDYAETPEMSAGIVTDEVVNRLKRLAENQLSFIVVNFANPDMLGHTGDMEETVKSVEFVDQCTKRIVETTVAVGGIAMVTSDHGNADAMFDTVSNKVDTKHTTNPSPFVLVSSAQECYLQQGEQVYKIGLGFEQTPTGMLADIAPTILPILGIEPPHDMTGFNLLDVM
jgi:2,3-bisphosphoglycerate-independent phosphoglycerate mutase